MGSRQRRPLNVATRKTRNRYKSTVSTRRVVGGCHGGQRSSTSVTDKLEALKNLIPAEHNDGVVKADRLFQQTADYIVLLRTQVSVLQKLVDFYGSSNQSPNVAAAPAFQ